MTCYATECPHITRDDIDNPILLAALDLTDAFLIAANRTEPSNDDYPSLFDHYATAATINADARFDCYFNMTATINLDDELPMIAISIFYDPDFDAPIRYIILESDTNLQIIFNANDPDFDPLRDLR